MLLTVEKWIRSGLCHSINRYGKANNRYMNDYDKNGYSPYRKYRDVSDVYGLGMSKKLPINGLK